MSKWLKKSVVVLITILSFGLVTPPQSFLLNKVDAEKPGGRDFFEENSSSILSGPTIIDERESDPSNKQKWLEQLMSDAEDQSFLKFGQKIKPVIEDEFRDVILPQIEKTITTVTTQYPDDELIHLTVSEMPGKGRSEKIFHVVNQKSGIDVIRFHVRRDQPPLQGYWFNFHYHTYHDQFQTHYDLGSIYWAKDTPPNWMS